MKEELQDKLVEILSAIQSTAGQAKDFTLAQLPDIAQSYVLYGRALASFWMLVAVAIFAFGFYLLYRIDLAHDAASRKWEAECEKSKQTKSGPYFVPSRGSYFKASDLYPLQFVPFVLAVAVVGMTIGQFLLVWFAPKVWLLKEIAGLIK